MYIFHVTKFINKIYKYSESILLIEFMIYTIYSVHCNSMTNIAELQWLEHLGNLYIFHVTKFINKIHNYSESILLIEFMIFTIYSVHCNSMTNIAEL